MSLELWQGGLLSLHRDLVQGLGPGLGSGHTGTTAKQALGLAPTGHCRRAVLGAPGPAWRRLEPSGRGKSPMWGAVHRTSCVLQQVGEARGKAQRGRGPRAGDTKAGTGSTLHRTAGCGGRGAPRGLMIIFTTTMKTPPTAACLQVAVGKGAGPGQNPPPKHSSRQGPVTPLLTKTSPSSWEPTHPGELDWPWVEGGQGAGRATPGQGPLEAADPRTRKAQPRPTAP